MKVQEIEIGKTYHLSGDIENGFMNEKPHISHEEVTRVVTRITETHVVCECGRRFLRNENLKITQPAYRDNSKR
jgi:hypothetical protein